MVISLLCSDVGRGHPFYLDGVRRALEGGGRGGLIAREATVFEVSRGTSLLAWRAVRWSYRIAGRGGPIGALYQRFRSEMDYDRDSAVLRILGRDLRSWAGDEGLLLVDHPAIVGALGGRPRVWYVHGEMVAPPEAIVRGAAGILVPTPKVADRFADGGVPRERIHITGICVENELLPIAQAALEERRRRLAAGGPLTLGFYSSGAEPGAHVASLAAGVAAAIRGGHAAIVVARRGGRLDRSVGSSRLDLGGKGPEIVRFSTRRELDQRTAEIFPRLDVVVSPPHERSNWAVGLGLPFLLVGPDFGPFAPRNRDLLLRAGVAIEIHTPTDAERLAEILGELQSRHLLERMCESGTGRPIDGFAQAARILVEEIEGRGDLTRGRTA
jgi:hypothetical protein